VAVLQNADVSRLTKAFFRHMRNGFIEAFNAGFEERPPETE